MVKRSTAITRGFPVDMGMPRTLEFFLYVNGYFFPREMFRTQKNARRHDNARSDVCEEGHHNGSLKPNSKKPHTHPNLMHPDKKHSTFA
jgi:hypothetical protein